VDFLRLGLDVIFLTALISSEVLNEQLYTQTLKRLK